MLFELAVGIFLLAVIGLIDSVVILAIFAEYPDLHLMGQLGIGAGVLLSSVVAIAAIFWTGAWIASNILPSGRAEKIRQREVAEAMLTIENCLRDSLPPTLRERLQDLGVGRLEVTLMRRQDTFHAWPLAYLEEIGDKRIHLGDEDHARLVAILDEGLEQIPEASKDLYHRGSGLGKSSFPIWRHQ